MNYSIIRDTGVRTGTFTVVPTGGGTLSYNDDYVENETIGLTLTATQSGDDVSINYTTTDTGVDGSITFTISTFRV
jgi:hypothetical protein